MHYNLIITIQANKCTHFYYNYNIIIKQQPLQVSGLTGPSPGNTQLHKEVNFNQLSAFVGLNCNNLTSPKLGAMEWIKKWRKLR